MDKVSVIIPCFNEEETIDLFYEQFALRTVKLRERCEFELIFVDDGSKDKTLDIIKNLTNKIKADEIKYISFSRNFGKEAAIYAGLKASTGDYVSLMDVDLQDPPEILVEMYEKMQNNKSIDCVASRRKTRKGEPVLRSFFARMFYRLINKFSETEIVDGARDFRLMKRNMVDSILQLTEKNRFSKGLFSWVGFKTEWISYENVERSAGKTKWNFWKLFKYALEGILGYSTVLLTLPTVFAILGGIGGLITLIFGIIKNSLLLIFTSIIVFLFVLMFLFMSNIGMYIARINKEVKNRPVFIVKERGDNR